MEEEMSSNIALTLIVVLSSACTAFVSYWLIRYNCPFLAFFLFLLVIGCRSIESNKKGKNKKEGERTDD